MEKPSILHIKDNTKRSSSTFLWGLYNSYKKVPKHRSSLCYFDPFDLHIEFQSSWITLKEMLLKIVIVDAQETGIEIN